MKIASQHVLTRIYSVAKRSGVLETSVGSELFATTYFLYKRFIEDSLRELLRAYPHLAGRGNILDIGANIGYTATVLERHASPGHLIYAFEPEPANYTVLRRIATRRELRDRIKPIQTAVGAEERTARLWLNVNHHADHRVITDHFRPNSGEPKGISVPMITIDGFLDRNPGPISFVKIDVQGFELPVCEGMSKTLERNTDVTVVLEYAPASMRELGFDPDRLLQFFAARGFHCFLIGADGQLSRGSIPALENGHYVDLLFSRTPDACI